MDKEARVKLKDEKKRVATARAKLRKALEKEPKVRVKFQNIEFPKASLSFNFEGVKRYVLLDGQKYDLPVSVINHLNSLAIPIYKMYEADEVAKGFNPEPVDPNERITGSINRFSLIPVDIGTMIAPTDANQPPAAGKAA